MRSSLFAVFAGLLTLPVAAHADLLGDTVDVSFQYPTATTTFQDLGDVTVPGAGAIANIASFAITSDQIAISSQVGQVFNGSFSGFEFTDLTTDPGITGVTIDPMSSADVLSSGISFTSDQVLVNLAGLTVDTGDTLLLNVSFAPAVSSSVTPEPTSIALLGTGLLGTFGVLRRRFVRS